MRFYISFGILVSFLSLISFDFALAVRSTSTSFIIESGEVTEGFNRSFGGETYKAIDESYVSTFEILNSFGQPAIGISTSSNYKILGGFLYFPAVLRLRQAPQRPSAEPKGLIDKLFQKFAPIVLKIRKRSVGEELVFGDKCLKGDLNCDERVDIIDVSILLYWWDKHVDGTELASLLDTKIESPDLDKDNFVDITDLSIQLYYWTG